MQLKQCLCLSIADTGVSLLAYLLVADFVVEWMSLGGMVCLVKVKLRDQSFVYPAGRYVHFRIIMGSRIPNFFDFLIYRTAISTVLISVQHAIGRSSSAKKKKEINHFIFNEYLASTRITAL